MIRARAQIGAARRRKPRASGDDPGRTDVVTGYSV